MLAELELTRAGRPVGPVLRSRPGDRTGTHGAARGHTGYVTGGRKPEQQRQPQPLEVGWCAAVRSWIVLVPCARISAREGSRLPRTKNDILRHPRSMCMHGAKLLFFLLLLVLILANYLSVDKLYLHAQ